MIMHRKYSSARMHARVLGNGGEGWDCEGCNKLVGC